MRLVSLYPAQTTDRDRWILSRRPARTGIDPWRPYAFSVEEERSSAGDIVSSAVVLLSNRECPWRCLMCDLWRNTMTEDTPRGAIPAQIRYALERLPRAQHIKLYNAGSFFDVRAIPPEDHPAIAATVADFERVVVESHPALIGDRCLRFRDQVPGRLEVAMGLETAHPATLEKLNKRMTVGQFGNVARFLAAHEIDLRTFILVKPPFVNEEQALEQVKLSIDTAFDFGSTIVSLIATRAGNGAMDLLQTHGEFAPPKLETVEKALEYGISRHRGRVFVDLWDLAAAIIGCLACYQQRVDRLARMNQEQVILPAVACAVCDAR